ncbi:RDD family protein [Micromonospora sp. CV4]|uniref:RDD family protein n=1 Tax=Micromonospora sp. CV4 TaxID=2478711 RepID=UPI000EF4E040|nr:RDD family protein [Micromonospora sp. CV4]RLP92781.1 RDD family protein [Micromonospora sp. CV4]
MSVQPGWYVDPADPETRRYWDGEGWLGAPIPVDETPPDGPPPVEPPPVPVTPAAPATPAAVGPVTAAPGWPPHPGPGAQPGHGPQQGYGPQPGQGPQQGHAPGWGPQATPPGLGPQAGPPGWAPQGAPPGWAPQGVPPGWPGGPPEPRPHGLALAGFGQRFTARLIDFGLVFALNALVNGWFVWRWIQEWTPYWREFFQRAARGDTSAEGLPVPGEQAGLLLVVILVIATALWLAYEVPAMAAGGQTFGKRVMRIRAVPLAADQPLGFGKALSRWTTLGMPTLLWYCAGLGLVLQLVDALSPLFDHPLRQALHDKRAQTVVVQVPRTTASATPNDRDHPSGETP